LYDLLQFSQQVGIKKCRRADVAMENTPEGAALKGWKQQVRMYVGLRQSSEGEEKLLSRTLKLANYTPKRSICQGV
jgi:hypothetical protein